MRGETNFYTVLCICLILSLRLIIAIVPTFRFDLGDIDTQCKHAVSVPLHKGDESKKQPGSCSFKHDFSPIPERHLFADGAHRENINQVL